MTQKALSLPLLSTLLLLSLGSVQLATCQQAAKANIYVAPTGNDNWSGTLEAPNRAGTDGPFASVDRAQRAVRDLRRSHKNAITVMLRQGTYFLKESLKFDHDDSGSPEGPIIYQAYPGEKPVISGGRAVSGWKVSGGRWVVNLNDYQNFEQLFVNGERRYRPRTTDKYLYNDGPVYVSSQSDACRVFIPREGSYECFDRFRFKGSDLRSDYANINDVEINDFEKWQMSKMRLKSVDTSAHIAYLTGPTFPNPNSGFIEGHRYLVENVKEELKRPGQWYFDRPTSQLTYIPREGERPENAVVIVPQLPQLIIAENLSYVTFKGITFSHDNWVVPPQGHQSLQSEPNVSAALSFSNSNHITFDSCTIAHTGGWGLEFVTGDDGPSHDNLAQNNVLYDLGTGGIRIGRYHQKNDSEDNVTHDNVVQNNLMAAGGRILPAGIGMGVWIGNSPGNTVTHNEIYDFYGGGIGVCVPTPSGCPFPRDNTVSYNHVYQQGQGIISDFAGIYIATYKTTGNRVINNRVHDVTHNFQEPDGYNGIGIYLDNITSNVLVSNNVVYRASQSVIFNNRGANNTWTNNILAYGHDGIVQLGGLDAMARNRMMQQRQQQGGPFGGQQGGPFGGPFGRRGGQRRRPGGPGGGQQQGGQGPQEQADPDKPALIFTHNIVIWDRGRVQKVPGYWACSHPLSGESVPCKSRFHFDSNLYWNPQGKEPVFAISDPQNPREANDQSMRDWQEQGEDEHSIVANPKLANVNYPADDFRLMPGSPAEKIGFQPFDFREAGLTTPLPRPPAQPPAFPLEKMDPEDY